MSIHNVFHVSLLDPYKEPVPGQEPSEPLPVITVEDGNGEEEWKVERVLDSRRRRRKLEYLVQWAGYSHIRTSWQPVDDLEKHSWHSFDSYSTPVPDQPPF